LNTPEPSRVERELAAEEILQALPEEARDTFADLAGVDRVRAEHVIQLLGLGSRTVLLTLGLVQEVEDGGSCRLALTDRAFPVMLAAAMSRCGLPASLDPDQILSQADAAVARIETRAREAMIKPAPLPVQDSIDAPTSRTIVAKIRQAAGQLNETPAIAALRRGVVLRVVKGQEPYAVIEMRPDGTSARPTQFLAYSIKDRAGRALLEGEEVRFLPAAAGSGEPVAVDIQPLREATTRSRWSRFRRDGR